MKTQWRDGERVRDVELATLGHGRWRVRVDGAEFELETETLADGRIRLTGETGTVLAEVTPTGARRFVRLGTLEFVLEREAGGRRRGAGGTHGAGLEAPMPGVVTKVMVQVGDDVAKGQPLLALEAMKMEHLIRAPHAGRVKSMAASPGQMVQAGVTLAELEE